jgi:phosphoribosylformylglycinamidine synthase
LQFGIHVDHGEGKLVFPDDSVFNRVIDESLVPMVYLDDKGKVTEQYPFNPNGSSGGIAGLCSPDGRHLAIMPHPERAFLSWQCHYLPERLRKQFEANGNVSPLLKMFQSAYSWCMKN